MKLLVCGGRDYRDRWALENRLEQIHARRPITLLIHGAQRGADLLAHAWAVRRGIRPQPCPADWTALGRAAGPVRNQQMLIHQPDLVVAFPRADGEFGPGTSDMIAKATRAGVPVERVSPGKAGAMRPVAPVVQLRRA